MMEKMHEAASQEGPLPRRKKMGKEKREHKKWRGKRGGKWGIGNILDKLLKQ